MSKIHGQEEQATRRHYDSPAASKVVRIVELLGKTREGLRITDIVKGIGSNLHTTTRLLSTLEREGWLRKDSEKGTYLLTLRPLHFFASALNRNDLVSSSVDPCRELWDKSGCLVELGVLDDDQITCVLKKEQEGPVRISTEIGARHPLHSCAGGKALLAWNEDNLWNRLTAKGFARNTANTITDPARLKENLATVRRLGYAVDDEEIASGVICLGAPIFNYQGDCIAGLHIATLTLSMSLPQMVERFSEVVIETAQRISAHLGFVPDAGDS